MIILYPCFATFWCNKLRQLYRCDVITSHYGVNSSLEFHGACNSFWLCNITFPFCFHITFLFVFLFWLVKFCSSLCAYKKCDPDLNGGHEHGCHGDGDSHSLVVKGCVVEYSAWDEEQNKRCVDGMQKWQGEHERAGELLSLSNLV